jgi:hypothetical protein
MRSEGTTTFMYLFVKFCTVKTHFLDVLQLVAPAKLSRMAPPKRTPLHERSRLFLPKQLA